MARFMSFSVTYDDVNKFNANVVQHRWTINKIEVISTDSSICNNEQTKISTASLKHIENSLSINL